MISPGNLIKHRSAALRACQNQSAALKENTFHFKNFHVGFSMETALNVGTFTATYHRRGQDRAFSVLFFSFFPKKTHSMIRCVLMITPGSKWSLPGSISIWVVILSHTLVLYLQAECKMKHIKVWGKWKRGNSPESFLFFCDNGKMFNPNLQPFWYLNPVFWLGLTPQRERKKNKKQAVSFSSPLTNPNAPAAHHLTWPDLIILHSTWTCSATKTLRLAPECPVTFDPIRPCVSQAVFM